MIGFAMQPERNPGLHRRSDRRFFSASLARSTCCCCSAAIGVIRLIVSRRRRLGDPEQAVKNPDVTVRSRGGRR
jgi:hypothetical protein